MALQALSRLASRLAVAALALAGLAGAAAAHPHVFVDVRTELVFDDKGQAAAVRHVWRFDDAFSAFASQGLDTDGDGTLTREELQPLAKVNVESLKEYDYFTFLSIGGKRAGFKIPTEYWLTFQDGYLTLFFTMPLVQPVKVPKEGLRIDVFDPTYFVDFTLVKDDPFLLVHNPPGCTLEVKPKGEPDAAAAAVLGQIPATEREIPSGLQAITRELANTIQVRCP
jgi:ABC-type uncharacterized transport system substrate-binding protein